MKRVLDFTFSVLTLFPLVALCQAGQPAVAPRVEEPSKATVGFESSVSASYQLGAKTKVGSFGVGRSDANSQKFSAVVTPQIDEDSNLRFGLEFSRHGFGGTNNFVGTPFTTVINPTPSSLFDLHLAIGGDVALDDEWLLRAEIDPGIYTTDFNAVQFKALNAPLIVGAAYLINKDLQWFFGVLVNARDTKLPIVPAVGVRWHYADEWTLNLLLPKPRLEYEPVKNLKFYVGAELDGGTYYVPGGAGYIHGRNIGDETVSYSEVTAGVGTQWNFRPNCSLEAGAGWLLSREFKYLDSDKRVHAYDAPAFSLSASAKF